MEKRKLKIGLLLDDINVSAWSSQMIKNIVESNYAEIGLVIINENFKEKPNLSFIAKLRDDNGSISSKIVRWVLTFLYSKLIERCVLLPDANESVNTGSILSDMTILKVKAGQEKNAAYLNDADITTIKEHRIDILIDLGFEILKGDILNAAKFGVWSFGDNDFTNEWSSGFWESMESWPETRSTLQILTDDPDNSKTLYQSFSCTNTMSVTDNRSSSQWKSLSFMTRKIKELYDIGENKFFERIEKDNIHPVFCSERLYGKPSNYELSKLVFGKIMEKTRVLFSNKFFFNQWILMFHLKDGFSSCLRRYIKIIPPKDRFWADPHVIYRDNKYYIFIEECLYSTQKGHISLLVMDENGNYEKPEIILEKPYHLSYPFVFEYQNEYYMIPESSSNQTIELYKCMEFPNKWQFQMNLMENVKAVDATVYYHNNKWWMFANIVENKGASSFDELFLFYAEDLFSNNWQPHEMNPIVSDCKISRPAGKIFSEKGRLYRPSQNCSSRYGYGFNINEITLLNTDNYSEELISSVKPNWDKSILGTHTFNRDNSLHVIDALYKRRK